LITVEEGKGIVSDIQNEHVQSFTPTSFTLSQNYPNPFSARGRAASGGNNDTSISFQIPKTTKVQLIIYDILGNEIVTLVDEERNPGIYVEIWRGNNWNGMSVSSGIYIYCLKAGEFVISKKMILLR
jgi:hypothetical protein